MFRKKQHNNGYKTKKWTCLQISMTNETSIHRYSWTIFMDHIHGLYSWTIFMDHIHGHLVGGFNHLEKYEFVKWDDDIPFPTVSGKS